MKTITTKKLRPTRTREKTMTQSTKNNVKAMLTAIYLQETDANHNGSSTPMHNGMITALDMVNEAIEEKIQQYTAILDSSTARSIQWNTAAMTTQQAKDYYWHTAGDRFARIDEKRQSLRRKRNMLYDIEGTIYEMRMEIHKSRKEIRG